MLLPNPLLAIVSPYLLSKITFTKPMVIKYRLVQMDVEKPLKKVMSSNPLMPSKVIIVVMILSVISSPIIVSFQITQAQTTRNIQLDNSSLDAQKILDAIYNIENFDPRQVILTIVSFFVALAMAIFGIQLAFRPRKSDVKYFTAAILALIIPVTSLLVSFIAASILGIPGLGIIAKNVWLFASLMLLIPIITLFVLLILHRRVQQNGD